jgi:hypothetical protein
VARPVGYRVAASEVPEAIERLLRAYLAERGPGVIGEVVALRERLTWAVEVAADVLAGSGRRSRPLSAL